MLSLLTRQTAAGLRILVAFTLLLGVAYPAAVWAVAQLPGLSRQAAGSPVTTPDGTVVGSALIGIDPVAADPATDPWFHTRPSAAPDGASGGSNKSTSSTDLLDAVTKRRALVAQREGVDPALVPPDAVTASASGLDPDISPAYAQLQVTRVARVTGLPVARVQQLVAQATSGRILGFLGEPTVNVPELNLAVRGG
ncbi:potassium-transporting ATPase subunit C [Pseudonocardia sp. CA-107938]|uniref:potassium-transporting ATPase subunit C n=1 Tax=Pseudonocardia sp. CA-107938 TaxID=3240021 RepID=UPI003D8EA138